MVLPAPPLLHGGIAGAERSTGLSQIIYATPCRTGALPVGEGDREQLRRGGDPRGLAPRDAIALAVQHTVAFSLGPYALIWGLLLVPTFLAWTAFVTASMRGGNRYAAYSVAWPLSSIRDSVPSRGRSAGGKLAPVRSCAGATSGSSRPIARRSSGTGSWSWAGGSLRRARGTPLARRGPDSVRILHRLAPGRSRRRRSGSRRSRWCRPSAWTVLVFQVSTDRGGRREEAKKDYWAKNLKILDQRSPARHRPRRRGGEVDPPRHCSRAKQNHAREFARLRDHGVPLTGGLNWNHLAWTMNEKAVQARRPAAPLRVHAAASPSRRGQRRDRLALGRPDAQGGHEERREHGRVRAALGVVLTGFTRASFRPWATWRRGRPRTTRPSRGGYPPPPTTGKASLAPGTARRRVPGADRDHRAGGVHPERARRLHQRPRRSRAGGRRSGRRITRSRC